jgi:hypothetical protein
VLPIRVGDNEYRIEYVRSPLRLQLGVLSVCAFVLLLALPMIRRRATSG